jgi:hypothetical protein
MTFPAVNPVTALLKESISKVVGSAALPFKAVTSFNTGPVASVSCFLSSSSSSHQCSVKWFVQDIEKPTNTVRTMEVIEVIKVFMFSL